MESLFQGNLNIMVESSNGIGRITYTGEGSSIYMLFDALRNGLLLIKKQGILKLNTLNISKLPILNLIIKNIHELCNLGARKPWGIEDSNNTEKNLGYNYKRAFSYI